MQYTTAREILQSEGGLKGNETERAQQAFRIYMTAILKLFPRKMRKFIWLEIGPTKSIERDCCPKGDERENNFSVSLRTRRKNRTTLIRTFKWNIHIDQPPLTRGTFMEAAIRVHENIHSIQFQMVRLFNQIVTYRKSKFPLFDIPTPDRIFLKNAEEKSAVSFEWGFYQLISENERQEMLERIQTALATPTLEITEPDRFYLKFGANTIRDSFLNLNQFLDVSLKERDYDLRTLWTFAGAKVLIVPSSILATYSVYQIYKDIMSRRHSRLEIRRQSTDKRMN